MRYELYGGEILLDFDPVEHKYTIDGRGIDGVSTALKVLSMSKVDDWAIRIDFQEFMDLYEGEGFDEDEWEQHLRRHGARSGGGVGGAT